MSKIVKSPDSHIEGDEHDDDGEGDSYDGGPPDFREYPIVPGTIVSVKSGGPKMTVAAVNGDEVKCSWFVGNTAHHGVFHLATLSNHDTPPPF